MRGNDVQAWHATQELTQTAQADIDRLLSGLRHLQMTPGIDVEPVVVHVGNVNGGPLSRADFNENWSQELLDQIHDQRRRKVFFVVRENSKIS